MEKSKTRVIFGITFSILVLAVFGLIMFHQLKHGDFPGYIQYAREFSENGYLYKIPHTLFERGIVIVRALLPANILVWVSPLAKQIYDLKSFEISALILTVAAYAWVAYLLIKRLLRDWEIKEKSVLWFAGLAVLVIMLVGPIFVFTLPDRMFLGYITGNRYDSPTYVVLKPFVLLIFFGLLDNLYKKWRWKQAGLMALAVVCATIAKPNFTITIIPALGIYLLIHVKLWKQVNWLFLFLAGGLPAFGVLLSQFIINYTGDRGDRLLIAPFKAILMHVPNMGVEILFILLSILFPLLLAIFYWKDIKGRLDFQLVWINFAVALVIGLVLAEEIYIGNNNVWNCPMIAVFLVFLVSVAYYGRGIVENFRSKTTLNGRQIALSGVLVLHIICGIIYYVATLLNTGVIVN